jgi:prepilin-type N-terminal cleavage/methylation domain-containing protein
MYIPGGKLRQTNFNAQTGFSMIELLVVMLIFGILVAVAVPTLIATQPERNLAASGDRFANDVNYARSKAEATGNKVYLAFRTTADLNQVQGRWDPINRTEQMTPTSIGETFINPANPGCSRVANEYVIVEERPRFNVDGSPLTYLDWLNQLDNFNDGVVDAGYPVEPTFPYDIETTVLAGTLPDPSTGKFNPFAAPLINMWMNMLPSGADYEARHWENDGLNGADWSDGHPEDQQYKVFCVADEDEILSYDATVDFDANGNRVFTAGEDHPRLLDHVHDYVLLKRVKLPEHVYFLNPWKDHWTTGWEDVDLPGGGTQRNFEDNNLQFLQYLWTFKPNGELAYSEWTFDPEPFDDGSSNFGITHGQPVELDSLPTIRAAWMVLDEVLDFGANTPIAKVMVQPNKKANVESSARMFSFWALTAKYYVDDYTPNDSQRAMDENDARLNKNYNVLGGSEEIGESVQVAREFGWNQDFLVQGTAP